MYRLLLLAFLLPLCAAAQSQPTKTIQELFIQTKVAHRTAQTYDAWSLHPHNSENLAETLLAIEADYTQEICAELKKLAAVDLFYAAEYLDQTKNTDRCIRRQKKRYSAYLNRQKRQLLAAYMSPLSDPNKKLGPSLEIKLDAKSTPFITDGGVPEKTLVLTFDDGPHATRTPELLKILKEENAQVQFFLVGRNTTLYPNVVKQAFEQGHEIGCHSFTHADLRKLSNEKAIAEIEDGFTAIQRALGVEGVFFRFPYGAHTTALREHLIKTETPEFFWNIDTMDWKYKDPTFLLEYTLKQIQKQGRGVVLFHDIQPQTISIMPALIAQLKNLDYKLAIFKPASPRNIERQP